MSGPQRMTKQRKIILEELRKLTTHPTADELYEIVRQRLPRVSLGTVYRNLDVLSEGGDILRLESAGSQKRFDGDVSLHYHVRCLHCGRVGDVRARGNDVELDDYKVPGFTLTHGVIEFFGVCDECKASGAALPPEVPEEQQ